MVRGLGLVHNNGRHVLVVRAGAGLVLLLAAAQGLRVLLLPAAGQTAQSRGRVLRLILMLLVLLLMLGLVRMLWLLMLLIDHNIIVVSVQQLRGQGDPPHGHHLVTSAAPERGAVFS